MKNATLTKMIKATQIVIIEDEKPAMRLLQRKVERLGYEVTACLSSVEEAVFWFGQNQHPDLILLDIQLADGISFDIFKQIEIQSAIIFTTAYDEYALKAFKLNSIDYLLKPIDEKELENAIRKYESRETSIISYADLIRTLNISQHKKRFTIKAGNLLKIIETEEIECFHSAFKSTFITTNEGKNYPLDDSLDTIEKELNPKDFFRANRQYIINLSAIKEISIYSNSRLKIKLNFYPADIIVSRERVALFKNWLG